MGIVFIGFFLHFLDGVGVHCKIRAAFLIGINIRVKL